MAEIEKQFTRLEAGVAALRRVQANLKRYRAAVLKAACEGQLVPTEAELARQEGRELRNRRATPRPHPHRTPPKLERPGKYKEPAAPDTANLPPLPEGWTWASVEQIGRTRSGHSPMAIKLGTILRRSSLSSSRICPMDALEDPGSSAARQEQSLRVRSRNVLSRRRIFITVGHPSGACGCPRQICRWLNHQFTCSRAG